MALLAVFSFTAGFWLLRASVGRLAGWLWIILGAINPYFLLTLRRAMGESPLVAGFMFSTLLAYFYMKYAAPGGASWSARIFILLGLLGGSVGITAAVKLNGLGLLALAGGVILLAALRSKAALFPTGIHLLVVLLVTGIVFVGTNPYLWPDPAGRTIKMFQHRQQEIQVQERNWADEHIQTLAQRVEIIPRQVLENNASLSFKGSIFMNAALLLVGLGLALQSSWRWWLGKETPIFPAILLAGAAGGLPPLLTTLDWPRYYVLTVIFATLLIAAAAAWGLKSLFRLLFSPGAGRL
jgi:hypothetical protein